MRQRAILLIGCACFLGWSQETFAQRTTGDVVTIQGSPSGTPVIVGDGAGALNVICDSGCSAGTSDSDDGSVAAAQTGSLSIPLTYFFGGTTWARWTGAALADNTSNPTAPFVGSFLHIFDGMTWDRWTGAVTQSGTWTVQPGNTANTTAWLFKLSQTTTDNDVDVASIAAGDNNIGNVDVVTMPTVTVTATNLDVQIGGSDTVTVTATNLDVQSGGADLATEATLAAALTSANFAAAFGTAGAPDTQVMSVQGIASMTPILATVSATNLDVQIGGSDTVIVSDGAGAMNVICDSGCGVSSFADNGTFTFGTTAINPTGMVFDDTSPNVVTEDSAAIPRMSSKRVPYSTIRDAAGNERGANVTIGNELAVGGDTLADLVDLLAGLVTDLHAGGLHHTRRTDRVGLALRTGIANRVVDYTNPLPTLNRTPMDPCMGPTKYNVAISQVADTQLVTGRSGMRIFVCYLRVVAGAAEIVNLIEGTGSVCATSTRAVTGSTTDANGESYAANGGASAGMGLGAIAITSIPGANLCLTESTTNRVSGNLVYAYAP